MKGVIFVALADMVQTKYGHVFWNDVIETSAVESQGIYTAAENYKDQEALSLLSSISKKVNKSSPQLLKIFGLYLIKYFSRRYPNYFKTDSYFDFLKSIDSVIHIEYKKINHDAYPPRIIVDEKSTNESVTIYYKSDRQLCSLASGLLKGAATIYKTPVIISHPKCKERGDSECEFLINILKR